MTCPNCTCTDCLSRPADQPKSPLSSLPGWARAERLAAEQFNALQLANNRERESWKDTYGERVG